MLNEFCEYCTECRVVPGKFKAKGNYEKKKLFCRGTHSIITPETVCPYGYYDNPEEVAFFMTDFPLDFAVPQ